MARLNRAVVAYARGDRETAAQLLEQVEMIVEEGSLAPPSDDQFEIDWLRGRLG